MDDCLSYSTLGALPSRSPLAQMLRPALLTVSLRHSLMGIEGAGLWDIERGARVF